MSAPRSTPAAEAAFELDVRKSRFRARAATAASPQAALAFVAAVSERDATHNCWAFRVGQQYRFADDGEPSGTAGKPILQAIDTQGFDQTVVVVTRWFGGIKLGAGGLVRAYGGCAAECLRGALRRELLALADVEFALPFALLPIMRARLVEHAATVLDETFVEDGAVLRARLPVDRVAALRGTLAELTRGRAVLRTVG